MGGALVGCPYRPILLCNRGGLGACGVLPVGPKQGQKTKVKDMVICMCQHTTVQQRICMHQYAQQDEEVLGELTNSYYNKKITNSLRNWGRERRSASLCHYYVIYRI